MQCIKEEMAECEEATMVTSYKEIEEAKKAGKFYILAGMEGLSGIAGDLDKIDELYDFGVRHAMLTWNEQNVLAGSHVTGGGLTDRGREFVKEARRVGMLIDVSHISDEAFWDIEKIADGPIIASHSNSRKICDHSRNLTDDMFLAICRSGGVAGINQYGPFVGQKPDLDTVCDHILHWLELDPEGRHIALGADLDGCDQLVEGFDGIQSYPALAARLLQRGLTGPMIENIFWNNALGVMEQCCI